MTSMFVTAVLAAGLLLSATTGLAQELTVTDSDANTLLQVNDEGDAGSLTLPPAPSAPADTANKLHNAGGALYWQDAQLGVWTRTGSAVHLTNASDNVGIGVADPDARLEVAGQVKITGGSPGTEKILASDADGLATWMSLNLPQMVYAQGDQTLAINDTNAHILRQLSITVPGPGVVLVQASGFVYWDDDNYTTDGREHARIWFHSGASSIGSADPDHSNLLIVNEYQTYSATDSDYDVYSPWSHAKSYAIGSAGTYTYRCMMDKFFPLDRYRMCDTNMQVIYFPSAATALTP